MSAAVPLGSVAKVQSGFAFKSRDWIDFGVPVIKIQNVRNGSINLQGCSFVSPEVAASAGRFRVERGDILITMSGEIGSVGVVRSDQHLMLNQRVGRIVLTTDSVDPRFVGFVLQHPLLKSRMESIAYGVAQPNISPSMIESLPIWVPAYDLQHKIADRLQAIDDLIENNRRRIEILEEMARLLYREWFVHFRYPGHEGVELVDSELGPIPTGWDVKSVKDVASVSKGLSYKGMYLSDDGPPMANLKCLKPIGGFARRGTKGYDGPFKERHAVVPGDIVVANTDLTQAGNVIGSAGLVPEAVFRDGGLLSHHLFRVRPEGSTFTVLRSLQSDRVRAMARGVASGTTVLGMRTADFEQFLLPWPPAALRTRFEGIQEPMHLLVENLEDQNRVLREARELLLPRLVSGELDVSDLDLDGVLA